MDFAIHHLGYFSVRTGKNCIAVPWWTVLYPVAHTLFIFWLKVVMTDSHFSLSLICSLFTAVLHVLQLRLSHILTALLSLLIVTPPNCPRRLLVSRSKSHLYLHPKLRFLCQALAMVSESVDVRWC